MQAKLDTGKGGGTTLRRATRTTPRKRDDEESCKLARHRRLFYIAFSSVSACARFCRTLKSRMCVWFRLRFFRAAANSSLASKPQKSFQSVVSCCDHQFQCLKAVRRAFHRRCEPLMSLSTDSAGGGGWVRRHTADAAGGGPGRAAGHVGAAGVVHGVLRSLNCSVLCGRNNVAGLVLRARRGAAAARAWVHQSPVHVAARVPPPRRA
jgi:hypothetical protein